MVMKTRRGRKGFGGVRVMVHLTQEIIDALEAEVERRKGDRISRAELIRRAIEFRYMGRKRDSDFAKRMPPKE